MKTITITIQVPDGVNVNVSQGGGQRSNGQAKGFTPKPDPPYPPAPCEVCGNDWKLIKAGVSKTKVDENGNPKRFNAFYVCNTPQCDGKPNYDAEPVYEEVGGDDLPF